MPLEQFDFTNERGETLSGRLERPDDEVRAYALFAHCFTCAKTSIAALRISRALAMLGVATLRFDFAGLGDSEGGFERAGFSGDVADVVSAANALAATGRPISLLIGHSLGGAAVLAAAHELDQVRAVAVIAAPFQPSHVLSQLGVDLATLESQDETEVELGGRRLTVPKSFVDDVRMQKLHERIGELGRPLLVLHSPLDAIVPIENASEIFLAARHPKSFVSLDHADHLMNRAEDAEFAANVIVAWAARYLPTPAATLPEATPGEARVVETGEGKYQVRIEVGGTRFLGDEPVKVGGLGTGPTPHELVAAGLGACTVMTVRLYADRGSLPLERVCAVVRYESRPGETPPSHFGLRLALTGGLSPEQTRRLFEIADACPVHRTLAGGAKIETSPLESTPPAATTVPSADHFGEMDTVCKREGTG